MKMKVLEGSQASQNPGPIDSQRPRPRYPLYPISPSPHLPVWAAQGPSSLPLCPGARGLGEPQLAKGSAGKQTELVTAEFTYLYSTDTNGEWEGGKTDFSFLPHKPSDDFRVSPQWRNLNQCTPSGQRTQIAARCTDIYT